MGYGMGYERLVGHHHNMIIFIKGNTGKVLDSCARRQFPGFPHCGGLENARQHLRRLTSASVRAEEHRRDGRKLMA